MNSVSVPNNADDVHGVRYLKPPIELITRLRYNANGRFGHEHKFHECTEIIGL